MPAPINTIEAQFEADTALLHQFMHAVLGDITTENGPRPNLAKLIQQMTDAWSPPAPPYDPAFFFKDKPANGTLMGRFLVVRPLVLPINLTGSRATAEVAPTGNVSLILKKGTDLTTATQIGTINFTAGNKIGTFTFTAEVTLAITETLYLVNAATADATLADVSATLMCHR